MKLLLYVTIISTLAFGTFHRDTVNEVVYDDTTQLTWQDNIDVTDNWTINWAPAIDYCENLTLAGKSDWRMPNINELYSIIDRSATLPAITLDAQNGFVNYENGYYLSSTTYYPDTNDSWVVDFSNGHSFHYEKSQLIHVRCVRDDQNKPLNSSVILYLLD